MAARGAPPDCRGRSHQSLRTISATQSWALSPSVLTSHVDQMLGDGLGHGLRSGRAVELLARRIEVEPDGPLADAEDDARLPRGFSRRGPFEAVELPRRDENLSVGVMAVDAQHMTVTSVRKLETRQEQIQTDIPRQKGMPKGASDPHKFLIGSKARPHAPRSKKQMAMPLQRTLLRPAKAPTCRGICVRNQNDCRRAGSPRACSRACSAACALAPATFSVGAP